jgi:hypothetical protein
MRGDLDRDRGAAAVEAAIGLPLLVFLVFGMLQLGALLKAYSSTANAVRAGGRMASVAGADPLTDQMALLRVSQELAATAADRIDVVVVWHASGPGDGVPEGCLPGGEPAGPNTESVGVWDGGVDATGACNVYLRPADPGGAFALAAGRGPEPASHYFGCEGPDDPAADHKLDCNWPGKSRRAVTTPRGSEGAIVGPDFVGIHLVVRHHVMDVAFDEMEIRESAVHLIEPHGYEV